MAGDATAKPRISRRAISAAGVSVLFGSPRPTFAEGIAGQAVDIRSFAGAGGGTDLSTWRRAMASLQHAGPVRLLVPAGVHQIPRLGLADKLRDGTIVVPPGVFIDCDVGAEIHYDYIGFPLFVFSAGVGGGFRGAKFVFTGATPGKPEFTREQFCRALGIDPKTISFGGDYEIWSTLLSMSDGAVFSNLSFCSESPGREQSVVPLLINLKPKDLANRAQNNFVSNINMRDYQFGVLYMGQYKLRIDGVDSDRRSGVSPGGLPMGHVIYSTGVGTNLFNEMCMVSNVQDGGDPINYAKAPMLNGATLAVKKGTNCHFFNIMSRHPAGIIQSIDEISNSSFRKFSWQTDDSTPPLNAEINIVSSHDGENASNLFDGFNVRSPNKFFYTLAISRGIVRSDWKNFQIVCDLNRFSGQSSGLGVFDIAGSSNSFDGINIIPSKPLRDGHNVACCFRRGGVGNSFRATIPAKDLNEMVRAQSNALSPGNTISLVAM